MMNNGGYILHLDATCEGDSPHIMTALDEVTNIVMNTIKITSEKAETIIPFLKKLKADYGKPIGIVSDMGKGIMNAVNTVFSKIPYFVCHFHFLRDIGKDLLESDYAELRKLLRKYNIKVKLRAWVKRIEQSNKENTISCDASLLLLKQTKTQKSSEYAPDPLTLYYLLLFWILNYKSELRGFGFPFDLSYLVFFKRLKQAYVPLSKLWDENELKKSHKNIINTIAAILEDSDIRSVTDRIIEKEVVFNELRECMQIALPESKEGLNDTGTTQNISSIKQKVSSFRNSEKIHNLIKDKGSYQKMISQIDKYWNYLFTDPIVVSSNSGDMTVQPQRTNNILEQFFRDLKRKYRKRTGTSNLSKSLKAMLAETPLIKNLENREYIKLITGDHKSLEELFSDIDENHVRDLLSCKNELQMSKEMKEIARKVNFPIQVIKYIKRTKKGKSNWILRS
ncbi:MAG: transposase [Desulfobacterales bacterium]|nr:transposase [Desulfobacterales bacterium]